MDGVLYEYRCTNPDCQAVSVRSLPIRRAPAEGSAHPRPCPVCGAVRRRVLSLGSITFEEARLKEEVHKYPFECFTHTGLAGCRVGPHGGSVIESPAHRREVQRMNGLGWR